MSEEITLRPEVRWFAEQMELQLQANDHKPGWQNSSYSSLLTRLEQETKELEELMKEPWADRKDEMVKECADIANFAMFLADNGHHLRANNPAPVFYPTHSDFNEAHWYDGGR